ncbi:MAG TPA: hypothetical protein VNK95_06135, partial [Caldilineaceae bacterium]|nr:hypothetical protein [Caldilineaceae bacterium]
MKLETRVERLEHEFKILKNEIQATLLEIQEQILTHYYPALRGEENTAPEQFQTMMDSQRSARPESLRPKDGAKPAASGNGNGFHRHSSAMDATAGHRISGLFNGGSNAFQDELNDLLGEIEEGQPDERGPIAPYTREVSLAELKRSKSTPEPAHPAAPAPPGQPARLHLDLTAYAAWVAESIRKVGKARAQKAIDTYAAGGYLPDEAKRMLHQLLELAEDDGPAEPANPAGTIEVLVSLD